MLRPQAASGKVVSLMFFLAMLLNGCSESPKSGPQPVSQKQNVAAAQTRITLLDHPAPDDSGEGSLLRLGSELLFSWIESADDTSYLKMSRMDAEQWSEPVTIASGNDWFVNWADFPAVAASSDGRLSAHWLAREGDSTYTYGVRVSSSDDALTELF